MTEKKEAFYLIFRVGERRFAIAAAEIVRVLAAVEVTPLPDTPSFLRGVINCGGVLVPVIDLRVRFGLPVRRVRPSDRLIFVRNAASAFQKDALLAFVDVGGSPRLKRSLARILQRSFQCGACRARKRR